MVGIQFYIDPLYIKSLWSYFLFEDDFHVLFKSLFYIVYIDCDVSNCLSCNCLWYWTLKYTFYIKWFYSLHLLYIMKTIIYYWCINWIIVYLCINFKILLNHPIKIFNLVGTTHFWNDLYRVLSEPKEWNVKYNIKGQMTQKINFSILFDLVIK